MIISRFIYVEAWIILHSFLWQNNIPLYGYATFYLSAHQLVDILFVSTFWLLWIMLLWTIGVEDFVQTFIFSSFSYIPKSRIAVSYGNSMFNFLRNCQTVFPSGTTILHFHQKCTRVPFSPYSFQYLMSFFIIVIPSGGDVLFHCGLDLHFPND